MTDDYKSRIELAIAYLRRPPDGERGLDALRRRFPNATEADLRTAHFHLYFELPEAMRDLLANLEESLRSNEEAPDHGRAFHVLYHLFNWIQFEALVPKGPEELKSLVEDVEVSIKEGDLDSAHSILKAIKDRLEGHELPPRIDES
ncbi:MAG: hypothetical protein M5U26_22080 [Planctomycetota bacterium]|nr:hypothetical protein [Planctomycetota bacterium]